MFWNPVTKDHLDALVEDEVPEGFQLEYKRELTTGRKVLEAVCAMANTFGGVIVVGMDETRAPDRKGFGAPGPDGLVGTDAKERIRLSAFCSNRLVPPYDPEIVAVDLGDGSVALVVRVDPSVAPRPLTVDDRVLVRTESGNRPADIFRLRSLFAETPSVFPPFIPATPWPINHPSHGETPPSDLVVRALASVALAPGPGRPILGDQARSATKDALLASALSDWLTAMHGAAVPAGGLVQWSPAGQNLSSRLELRWTGILTPSRDTFPEAWAVIEWPRPVAGSPFPDRLTVKIDVVLRLVVGAPNGAPLRRLPVDALYLLLRSLLDTFGDSLPDLLASIMPTAVGPIEGPAVGIATRAGGPLDAVIQTTSVGLVQGEPIGQGGSVYPFPGLVLSDPVQRAHQARHWLQELLLDNGFLKVDGVIEGVASRCDHESA